MTEKQIIQPHFHFERKVTNFGKNIIGSREEKAIMNRGDEDFSAGKELCKI